jgi:tetratricopeptide (TPR) repeat protein
MEARMKRLLVALWRTITGARVDQKTDRDQFGDPELHISVLTRMIESGLPATQDTLDTLYFSRGRAYAMKGDFDRAIADFDEALALNPDYAAAYTNRGLAYEVNSEVDRAIADFSMAVEIDPSEDYALESLRRLGVIP